MQAGQLRRAVTVQERSLQVDDAGGQSPIWRDVVTLRAFVVPTGGSEVMASGETRSKTVYQVTTRWFPDLTPKHRLIYEGKVFDILNINDVEERRRELQFTCTEGLSDG